MKIAFLLLTYSNPYFNRLYDLMSQYNFYIHPKFPNLVDENYKSHIIPNLIETEWGKNSIVQATINLLEYAYKQDKYDYFILLSEDTCPVYKKHKFIKFIKSLNGLSCFELLKKYNNIYKSYQWWIINNIDAYTIINTQSKYISFLNNIKLDGAPDENYFLTILHFENKNYKFNNMKCIFTRWIHNTIIKHPFIFNKITKKDITDIIDSKAFFIRKCTSEFKIIKYIPKKKLLITFIGSLTNQKSICNILNEYDIIIISPIDNKLILSELKNNCIYIINIIWKFYNDSIQQLFVQYKYILYQWSEIYISDEIFDINKLRQYDIKLNKFLK
jgi:hypothetical protein